MKLRKELVLRHIGDDYMIVDPSKDEIDMTMVYTLNNSAAWIWKELLKQESFTEQDVVDLLMRRYEVTYDAAIKDVRTLLERFRKNKLIID